MEEDWKVALIVKNIVWKEFWWFVTRREEWKNFEKKKSRIFLEYWKVNSFDDVICWERHDGQWSSSKVPWIIAKWFQKLEQRFQKEKSTNQRGKLWNFRLYFDTHLKFCKCHQFTHNGLNDFYVDISRKNAFLSILYVWPHNIRTQPLMQINYSHTERRREEKIETSHFSPYKTNRKKSSETRMFSCVL